ncbi:vacuolar protein sorting-associated protein 53 A-like protein, partial [Tanacetum coccineum]
NKREAVMSEECLGALSGPNGCDKELSGNVNDVKIFRTELGEQERTMKDVDNQDRLDEIDDLWVEQVVCNTSATMSVQGIFRDLKKLDFAKKQITIIITALYHLTMLGPTRRDFFRSNKRCYKIGIGMAESAPGYEQGRKMGLVGGVKFPESGWLMLGLLSRVADVGFAGALADAGCLWYRNCMEMQLPIFSVRVGDEVEVGDFVLGSFPG